MSEPTINVVEPTTLLSCPFCGATDDVMTTRDFWAGAIPAEAEVANQVGCTVCDIWTPAFDTEEEAIAAWNRRASYRTTTRHGRYRTKYGRKVPLCQCCGYSIGDLRWKFCPSCGAEVVE